MPVNISNITIKATAQKVWDALTKPEAVKEWQYGSELITDWKAGSSIRFSTPWEGKTFEQWGTVLEVVPNKLIKYRLFAPRPELEDKPENYFVMTYSLTETGENIILEIKQEDGRPAAVEEATQGEENPILSALKVFAEK